MALAFARMEFVKRSQGKNAVCKAAYIERCRLEFDGTKFQLPAVYSWAELEKPIFSHVYLPEHVDASYKDIKTLWNAVERFEKRKDSQVGLEIVLALPDDQCVSLNDKIILVERFVNTYLTSKGYVVQVAIHPPDKIHGRKSEVSGSLEKTDHNWHCHLFITPRTFDKSGKAFSSTKIADLFPNVRGASHFAFNGVHWGKVWAQLQNDFFEEKGLNLRVDPEAVVSQEHLGAVRLRGRKIYAKLEQQEERHLRNQDACKDPERILEKLTSTSSVFTVEDVENYFRKHASEKEVQDVFQAFWLSKEIVELYSLHPKESGESTRKFSTVTVIEEEKKIMRLASRIQERQALKSKILLSQFKKSLNAEQQIAFDAVVSKSSLSCIEGHAGTGKSYLLVALKNFYESNGYTVRAFGPDNATVRVLEEKGFKNALNTHKFLFSNFFAKESFVSKNEVWIVDESGKLGNGPLLELLKQAEKSGAQLIFSGNSAQLASVERGGMFKRFCDTFGCVFLRDVQRQSSQEHRDISQNLAKGNFNDAINMIAATGGFKWSETKEEAVLNLVEKWVSDRSHHPYGSQLIIAHSNAEMRQLNEIVHFYRTSWGELGSREFTCQTSFGKINVSEGDVIEFRQNNRELGVTNGLLGILVSASEEKFVIRTQAGEQQKEIVFDPRKFTSYQLGYATTYYRAQGRTVDRAYVLYSKYMNKPLFYVGLTRHVRNAHCFVSREDAKSLSVIKLQAQRSSFKESSLNYTTRSEMDLQKRNQEEKEKIDALGKSDQVLDRVKGGYLKTWGAIKSKLFGYIEKVQDRKDSKEFYRQIKQDTQNILGQVIDVSRNEASINWSAVEKVKEEHSFAGRVSGGSVEIKNQNKKNSFQTLSENQKISLRNYFEKVDEASTLLSIVKSETNGSSAREQDAPSFGKWQVACGERNMAAHTLSFSTPSAKLKELFGKMPLEILKDRADRHERTLSPKINLIDQLKENIEPLLQRLFPEGPMGKDSKGFRFGLKGSFSVVCKGDKLGCFYDFEKKEGGDILRLIQTRLCLNESDTKAWAYSFLNHPEQYHHQKQYSTACFSKAESKEWISEIPSQNLPVPRLREISRHLDNQYLLVAQHPYYDNQGNLIQYTLRLQEKNNPSKKIVLPLSFGRYHESANEPKWTLKRYHFEKDRNPIYNSHLLKEHPSKPVLIVEGEKTADAGAVLFDDHVVTISWLGGSSGANKADWGLLAGREVIIWPDNDVAGFKAAEEISTCLRKVGVKSLRVVDSQMLSKEFPQKWDLADAIPQGKNFQFLKDCLLRAESKAINVERLKDGKDLMAVGLLNEILWRVDERMRPNLEKDGTLKLWDIENRIISEVSTVINSTESLLKTVTNISGQKSIGECIVFQGLLHRAKTGTLPSIDRLSEIKKVVESCGSAIDKVSILNERTHTYALNKTCMAMLENRMEREKIKECFQGYLNDPNISQMREMVSKDINIKREMVIANI